MAKRICMEPDCGDYRDARGYCGKHYQRRKKAGEFTEPLPPRDPICQVDGCDKPKYGTRSICSMHHARRRRYGDFNATGNRRKPGDTRVHTDGYIMVYLPDHPLAIGGLVYQHRAVLYAAIGPAAHLCELCERTVKWDGEGIAKLVVDHIDEDPANNAPDNLRPTCRTCNAKRGGHAMARRTHCKHGHEFTPENTLMTKRGRSCRECRRIRRKRASKPRWVAA